MIKNIFFFIEFAFIRICFVVLNLFPLKISSGLISIIFKFFGRLSKNHKIAIKNCKHVFPNHSDKEVKKIVLKSWSNLGKTVFELAVLKKIFKFKLIETKGVENINSIIEKKIPAIYFGIHHSNWEICVPLLDRMGIMVGAIYRHINNHFLNKFVLERRIDSLETNKSFYTPKGKQSAKDILDAVKKNKSIFLLIDQKDSAGEEVILFNKYLKTQTGFLKIARKYNMPLVPLENKRLNNGKFLLIFHEPIFHSANISDSDMMKKIHQIVEKWILNNPNQWFWQHNRFN